MCRHVCARLSYSPHCLALAAHEGADARRASVGTRRRGAAWASCECRTAAGQRMGGLPRPRQSRTSQGALCHAPPRRPPGPCEPATAPRTRSPQTRSRIMLLWLRVPPCTRDAHFQCTPMESGVPLCFMLRGFMIRDLMTVCILNARSGLRPCKPRQVPCGAPTRGPSLLGTC